MIPEFCRLSKKKVMEKGPSCVKKYSIEIRDVEDVPKFAMRQQRKDVSPKYKEAQRELRCYFSGVSQRRIERGRILAASGARCAI